MSSFKRMRLLRLKHGISLPELSRAAGVSHQYLSDIELSECAPTSRQREAVCLAFERVIATRHGVVTALAMDYETAKGSLFDLVETESEGAL